MEQPVPRVSQSDVDRIIARDFEQQARERLTVLLADPDLTLSPRVILAVLKLSNGEIDAVGANIEAARSDWRDVIAYAEYPAYMKAGPASVGLSAERRDEVVRADWEQYQTWLND